MGLFTTNKNNDNAEDVFHFPTSKNLLLIFTRNPELGKCKTRLAATVGDENAAHIVTGEFSKSEERVLQADIGGDEVSIEFEVFKRKVYEWWRLEKHDCVEVHINGPQRRYFEGFILDIPGKLPYSPAIVAV